jgi:hypothetical protein
MTNKPVERATARTKGMAANSKLPFDRESSSLFKNKLIPP